MSDGSKIESPAYCHIILDEPSDIIVGTGQRLKIDSSAPVPFGGVLQREWLDSTAVDTSNGEAYFKVWLKDSAVITFKDHECLVMIPDMDTGLYCTGRRCLGWFRDALPFKGY